MDPSDHDMRDLGNGASEGSHGPTHANGGPPGGDGWMRSVLENSDEVVKVLDPDGTLRYASPAFGRVFGYDPGEVVGNMNVLDHVHPDDLPHVLEETERALSEGRALSNRVEYRFRHKNGSWRWVESVGTYLLDDPAVNGVVVQVRDITGRKEAEERYRTLVESVPLTIYIERPREGETAAYDTTYISPRVEEMLGYPPQSFTGNPNFWSRVIHPEDLGAVREEDERTDETGEPFSMEYRIIARDGRTVWIRDEATLVRDDGGEPLYWLGVQTDVTGRREAEERYRTLVEQIPAVTYVHVQEPGGFSGTTYVSPQVEGILGYTPEEYTSDPEFWKSILHPEDRERVLAHDERTGETGEEFHLQFRMLAKDGRTVWLGENGRLVDAGDDGRQVWHGVMFDITEPKRAEEALRESEERFRGTFEDAPIGVALVGLPSSSPDQDRRYLRVNPALCEMLGYAEEELLSMTTSDVTHPEDLEKSRTHMERLFDEGGSKYTLEKRYVRSDGRVVWAMLNVSLVGDPEGNPSHFVAQFQDVTERRALEDRLRHQTLHDDLTGLPNRTLFMDRLGQALGRTRRRDRLVAVLFMDLDEFKGVNDSLGHDVGDLLLVLVAERLKGCLRPEDTLARFGGDEFVLLVEDVEDPGEAVKVAERITDELRRPFALEGRELYVSASVGISFAPPRTESPRDLLRDADTAMYRAKEAGGGYEVFDPAMHERAVLRLALENDLRRAIEEDEFVVHYQPIVNLQSGELWGMEALVRWEHPGRGLLNPDEFVPIAEESGLVVPMGELVLDKACRQAVEWQRNFPRTPPLAMSVNLSGRQLRRPDLHEIVGRALEESGLSASSLGLDITETVYISALDANTAALDRLKALGIRISLDDFGSGYSSLSYLKRLPADILKIDRSFTKGLGVEAEDTAIVQTVVDLAHILGMEVVAEGVEIEEQETLLREMDCDMAQGHHFSKPLQPGDVPGFLAG